MKFIRFTKTLGLCGLILFTPCSYSDAISEDDSDILDMVMPAILASANSSRPPIPGPNQKLMTFSKLAKSLGKPQEITVSVAHYTDPLTAPQVRGGGCIHQHLVTKAIKACDTWNWKGQCTHQYVVTAATYACDTWGPAYKRYMNCDYYAHVKSDFYMLTQNQFVDKILKTFAKDIVDFSITRLEDAVKLTIAESTVAAAGAAIYTEGVGAIPAFVGTFEVEIKPNLVYAMTKISDHVIHLDFIDSVSGANAPVKVDEKPACGWGNWSRI